MLENLRGTPMMRAENLGQHGVQIRKNGSVRNLLGSVFEQIGRATLVALIAALLPSVARAQSCDTGDPCMTDGMCMPDGTCEGTPITGGSCAIPGGDVTCMVNGHCVNGVCMGDFAPEGTSCAAGCGTCEPLVPGVPFTSCMTKPGQGGQPCDTGFGVCFVGTCSQAQFAFCQPTFKTCPDTDHNPCTTDACNPATGQCEHFDAPPCIPTCEVCNPANGACQPANEGVGCEDFNQCTTESHCEAFDTGAGIRGLCMPGAPTVNSPIPTATTGVTQTPTPTTAPTVTATPSPTAPGPSATPGGCPGDCNGDHEVTVDELVLGVNILLETSVLSQCPSFDVDNSGAVEVNELVLGVNILLNGCNA